MKKQRPKQDLDELTAAERRGAPSLQDTLARMRPRGTWLGLSWGDVGDFGNAAFPYVHTAGKGIASAFGAGAAAQALEDVEVKRGWLPAQGAPSAAAPGGHVAPGAMPMKPTAPTPSTASTPMSLSKHQPTFLQRFETPLKVAGAGAFIVGALMLVRHVARKK